jgi:RNA polymerase sigma-70 factor (ECF subfamily)
MPPSEHNHESNQVRRQTFSTTLWGVVLAARDPSLPGAAAAMEKLCQTYWYPLYLYVRRSGHGADDAQDLTQEFFARLIAKNYIASAEPQKGKFRSFLLIALKRFLMNEWNRANCQKRGGGQVILSLDQQDTESRYLAEPVDPMTPEKAYERRWALIVLEQAVERLRAEAIASGKIQQFDHLKGFLSGETGAGDYAPAAAVLKTTERSVAVTVNRMRQRYRELVRSTVAETLANPAEIDDEIRHLFVALGLG